MKVSQTSYDYIRPYWDQIGTTIVGRHVFVDGIEAAVAKAQELAGGRLVEVAAGDVGGQVLHLRYRVHR